MTDSGDSRWSPHRRTPFTRWGPAAAVVVLLAVAAPAVPGIRVWAATGPTGHGRSVGALLAETAAGSVAVLVVVAVAALVMAVSRRRRQRHQPDDETIPVAPAISGSARAWGLLGILAVLAAPLLVVVAATHTASRTSSPPATRRPVVAPTSPPTSFMLAHSVHVDGATLVGLLVGVAAITVLLIVATTRRQPPGTRAEHGPEAVLATAEAAREDLTGDDPRAAVLRAYATMTRLLTARGIGGRRADTADEFLARALAAATVPAVPAARLTGLFGRARYSSHPFGEADRAAAAAALDEVRAGLHGQAGRR